jgi:NAD(P)-dependent dehydrogenase (short-subunit alcohol dehydrogenase family)
LGSAKAFRILNQYGADDAVLDETTIQSAAEEAKRIYPVNDHHLHLTFCIPRILYPEKSPSQLQQEQLTKTFAVNTIGPMLIAKHFSPLLPRKVHSFQDPVPLS